MGRNMKKLGGSYYIRKRARKAHLKRISAIAKCKRDATLTDIDEVIISPPLQIKLEVDGESEVERCETEYYNYTTLEEEGTGAIRKLCLLSRCVFCLRKTDDEVSEERLSNLVSCPGFLRSLNWAWRALIKKEVVGGILDFQEYGQEGDGTALKFQSVPEICQACLDNVLSIQKLLFQVTQEVLGLKQVVKESLDEGRAEYLQDNLNNSGVDVEVISETVEFYDSLKTDFIQDGGDMASKPEMEANEIKSELEESSGETTYSHLKVYANAYGLLRERRSLNKRAHPTVSTKHTLCQPLSKSANYNSTNVFVMPTAPIRFQKSSESLHGHANDFLNLSPSSELKTNISTDPDNNMDFPLSNQPPEVDAFHWSDPDQVDLESNEYKPELPADCFDTNTNMGDDNGEDLLAD